jgi:hypothetical protein
MRDDFLNCPRRGESCHRLSALPEPEERYVVEVMVTGAGDLRRVDLDGDHFREKLVFGGQQVAGVGAVQGEQDGFLGA